MSLYPQLAPLAEDLVTAPASQAFVERIFSVCGMLTTCRRNRMEKSLEMCVFLKLIAHLINAYAYIRCEAHRQHWEIGYA